MSSLSPLTILIVGNGVAGPILAMALQKATPHKVILVDAGPEESLALGGAIGISANGIHALKFIGGEHIILDNGGRHQHMGFRRGDTGATLTDPQTEELFTQKFEYPNYGIIRQKYCEGLRALAKERGIDMRFKLRLKTIEEHDNKVTAHFANGESITADLLVGCDGIHSPTRTYVVGEEIKPDYANASVILGLSTLTQEEANSLGLTPGFSTFLGNNSNFGVFKVDPHDTWGWFFIFHSPDPAAGEAAWGEDHSVEKLTALISSKIQDWKAEIPDFLLKKAFRVVPLGLYDRKPLETDWHRGRVVLVGDAAHPTTPAGGQGSQMAAESAVILARLLADHEPSDELFKRYAALRHHRTDGVTATSRRLIDNLLVSKSREVIRNTAIWLFGSLFIKSGAGGHYAYDAGTVPL